MSWGEDGPEVVLGGDTSLPATGCVFAVGPWGSGLVWGVELSLESGILLEESLHLETHSSINDFFESDKMSYLLVALVIPAAWPGS